MARIWATFEMEEQVRNEGFAVVAGMDEVGRGPLAGPISVGVVILPEGFAEPVVDSKLLSPQQREEKATVICAGSLAFAVGHVEPEYIDQHGVTASLREAGRRALASLDDIKPDIVLLDGRHNFLDVDVPVRSIVKGDRVSVSIAAASIIAKVERDALMRDLAQAYPEYGFENHLGYGTTRHIAAIKEYGPSPVHRKLFLRKVLS